MPNVLIRNGMLSGEVCTEGGHGWGGLSDLKYNDKRENCFLSPVLTPVFYFGVPMAEDGFQEYEPCDSKKTIENISKEGCTLKSHPMPCSQVTSSITYEMVEPYYIDVTLNLKTQRSDWPFDVLVATFSTIVRAPIYSGIILEGQDGGKQVKGGNRWVNFNGMQGKIAHPARVDSPEIIDPEQRKKIYHYTDSSVRFDRPFFYGSIEEMVFACFFPLSAREQIRFTVNPLAGAFGGPAWDVFWIIDSPSIATEYEMKFRTVFKPFEGANDILNEYETYLANTL